MLSLSKTTDVGQPIAAHGNPQSGCTGCPVSKAIGLSDVLMGGLTLVLQIG